MQATGPDQAAARVEVLRVLLNEANYRYYVLDAPTLLTSNTTTRCANYNLEAAYPELLTQDSPTQRVGAGPLKTFAEVPHVIPMLSLGNAFSEVDVAAFDRRVREGLEREASVIEYAVNRNSTVWR